MLDFPYVTGPGVLLQSPQGVFRDGFDLLADFSGIFIRKKAYQLRDIIGRAPGAAGS